ncbi:MAG TPA: 3-isopropylmalate dehydratase [Candidatus Dormibacteraeota bacterium]|nr:3-isopropylmalate dehydratase [Candidatus Dormibacteraeota bacterium]
MPSLHELRGRAWCFGADISTDMLSPGQYVHHPMAERLRHVLEAARPEFAGAVRPGDIVVAGPNFGCGSSRESAPQHLVDLGVVAVVADSLARIFARNAIAVGLPVLACPGISTAVRDGELVAVDVAQGRVAVGDRQQVLEADRIPEPMLDVLRHGGIEPLLRTMAAAQAASADSPPPGRGDAEL